MAENQGAQMSAGVQALADDVRHLEDSSRSNGERTQQTFEALQGVVRELYKRLLHLEARAPEATERRVFSNAPDLGKLTSAVVRARSGGF